MEFWGVEVKSGEPLKVQPDLGKLIHISQAALGEVVKDVKGAKNVPLRLKIDGKNFIIGSLSAEDRTQLMFDLVFEREFELSHDWKNGSVYFIGYVADDQPASDVEFSSDDFSDDSEDEAVENRENGVIKPKAGNDLFAGALEAAKGALAVAAGAPKKKKEQSDSDDSEDDSDDEIPHNAPEGDTSDDVSEQDSEEDDSSEDELPKLSKKRLAGSEKPAPVPAKKAKSSTPDKTGNKKSQPAPPLPSKAAGKKPAGKTPPGDKSKQSPKSGGQFSGKSGNKSFNSKNGKGGKRGGK